jgi:hypothetical protein
MEAYMPKKVKYLIFKPSLAHTLTAEVDMERVGNKVNIVISELTKDGKALVAPAKKENETQAERGARIAAETRIDNFKALLIRQIQKGVIKI